MVNDGNLFSELGEDVGNDGSSSSMYGKWWQMIDFF